MGNLECCGGDDFNVQFQLLQGQIYEQKRFFTIYPAIQDVVNRQNLSQKKEINKKLITKFEYDVFMGKENARVRKGKGIMLYVKAGLYYMGEWSHDLRDGTGTMIDQSGAMYQGQWYKDNPHGVGIYFNCDKSWIFKGKWRFGMKEGPGQEWFPDGAYFAGFYKNNVKQGRGIFKFGTVCYFQGTFQNDVANGQGKQRGQNYLYQGNWENGRMNGAGKCTYYNDDNSGSTQSYIGQFKDNQKHGYGQYRWSDGSIYKGLWENGIMLSKGVYIRKQ